MTARDLLAPGDQARAAAAVDDLCLELSERVYRAQHLVLGLGLVLLRRHQSAFSRYQAIVASSPRSKSWYRGRQPSSSRSLRRVDRVAQVVAGAIVDVVEVAGVAAHQLEDQLDDVAGCESSPSAPIR